MLGPSLLEGNTAIFKPSEDTPAIGQRLYELFLEAGFPQGVINLVHGDGISVGVPLTTHPEVDMVSFTGSTRAGVQIAQNAAPSQALPLKARSPVSQGPLQAVWIGSELVLARGVKVEEGTFFQGCWLDWDLIRRDLLEGVVDLVPIASLEPVDPSSSLPPNSSWNIHSQG